MKHARLTLTALLTLVYLTFLPGCPTASKPGAAVVPAKGSPKSDPRRLGLELLRQASEPARYQEGLQLLNAALPHNPDLQKRLVLGDAERRFLTEALALNADEMREVESPSFRPADAYYLADCFLLRDAARALEMPGLSAEALARHGFAWVCRQVLLHEQGETGLPPSFVLRRGYGSATDRALVFLALMRQLQLEGCLFVQPDAADDVVLVGILDPGAQAIRLFDPRLGQAVRTADGTAATIGDVAADPKLLAPSELTVEQFRAAPVRLVAALEAVAPRMRDLANALTVQDRIVLHLDAAQVQKDIDAATGRKTQFAEAPARALRRLLPADEGGIDTDQRLKHFRERRVPWVPILRALEEIKLGPGQLPDPALAQLTRFLAELFDKYELQPHEMLLRGKGEEFTRRLERARSFLENESLGGLANDPEAQKEIADWRARISAAYGAVAAKEAGAMGRVNAVWGEDFYFLALLNVDAEEPPERFPKKVLTRIVAQAAREPLVQRTLWLRAMLWQEKAERDQIRADRAAGKGVAAGQAHSAWLNTRPAWGVFLDRTGLSPAARQARLDAVRAVIKRRDKLAATEAAGMLEALHLDLRRHYAARLHQARAARYLDGAASAADLLRGIEDELAGLLAQDKEGRPGLTGDIQEVRQRLQAPAQARLIGSLELLERDWAPHGNYYWLRQRVRRQLAAWGKG